MKKVVWIGLLLLGFYLPLSANNDDVGRVLLDDFDKESESPWNASEGANVKSSLTFGERLRLDDNEEVVLKLGLERKDTSNHVPARN